MTGVQTCALPISELRKKRMIPILTKIRAKTVEEFGSLIYHSGEEYTYVLEGRVEVHTEFYEPVTLEVGQSIYLDSKMGHAYLAGEGCEEATVIALCSSASEDLMDSLLTLHGPELAKPEAPVRLHRPRDGAAVTRQAPAKRKRVRA